LKKQHPISPNGDRPRRVLIVRIGAMGDVLHAMPAVAALRQRHPDWFIGWAIDPCWSKLLQASTGLEAISERGPGMPLVDRCYRVPTREWKQQPVSLETLSSVRAVRRELLQEKFDLCVDMQGSIRSSMIGRMAGADRFAGYAEPRERPARWMYRQKIRVNAAHVIEQGCEILGAAVGEPLTPVKVELPTDNAAEIWRDELLSQVAPEDKFVVIAPSAGWGAKQWPAERYGAVAAELASGGYVPLVNAVFSGDLLANAVVDASGGTAVVVPCSVGQLIALTRRASLVIAGDTGPLHLAAALERPVVAVFGPTDPARNGPYGTRSRVLRHASSRKDHTRHAETEEGLMQITTDEVVSAAFDLLRSANQGKAR